LTSATSKTTCKPQQPQRLPNGFHFKLHFWNLWLPLVRMIAFLIRKTFMIRVAISSDLHNTLKFFSTLWFFLDNYLSVFESICFWIYPNWIHPFLNLPVFEFFRFLRAARNPDFFLFTVCSVCKNMQHQNLSFCKSRNPDWKDKTWWFSNFSIAQFTMAIMRSFFHKCFKCKKQQKSYHH
jgi:hypothetical protein